MVKILVVDDDSDLCQSMRSALEGLLGHTVFVANDAETALELQRRCQADVVVTDIFMPVCDGLEFIQALRRDHEGLKVIAMSGMPERSHGGGRAAYQLVAARALGASATIAKPFDLHTLAAAIDSVVGNRANA